jgi:beta-lactamase class A
MAISVGEEPDSRGWRYHARPAQILAETAAAAHRRFPNLRRNDLEMTLVVPAAKRAIGASHRGDHAVYPASVVKLFYLTAVQAWLDQGKLNPTRELRSALAAMIGQSSNDATNHIVDLLTGTTGGPDLPPAAFRRWLARRRSINRYFEGWGCPEFAGINLMQKTWGDAPYGRERQSRYEVPNNRNALTTDAVARLLLAIARGEAVNARRSAAMMKLLSRPIPDRPDPGKPFDQVFGFFGEGLPKGSRLWSKAGWTSTVKHDAAIVRLPDRWRFILVAFTTGAAQAGSKQMLPFIARNVAAALATVSADS